MFVSNPVRDEVTCDTYSQLHLLGVMTNIFVYTYSVFVYIYV